MLRLMYGEHQQSNSEAELCTRHPRARPFQFGRRSAAADASVAPSPGSCVLLVAQELGGLAREVLVMLEEESVAGVAVEDDLRVG